MTTSGVSAAKVVATIAAPASHQRHVAPREEVFLEALAAALREVAGRCRSTARSRRRRWPSRSRRGSWTPWAKVGNSGGGDPGPECCEPVRRGAARHDTAARSRDARDVTSGDGVACHDRMDGNARTATRRARAMLLVLRRGACAARRLRPDGDAARAARDHRPADGQHPADSRASASAPHESDGRRRARRVGHRAAARRDARAAGVQLVELFSPEHGIRGTEDREHLASGIDERSGLFVHSLYRTGRIASAGQHALAISTRSWSISRTSAPGRGRTWARCSTRCAPRRDASADRRARPAESAHRRARSTDRCSIARWPIPTTRRRRGRAERTHYIRSRCATE